MPIPSCDAVGTGEALFGNVEAEALEEERKARELAERKIRAEERARKSARPVQPARSTNEVKVKQMVQLRKAAPKDEAHPMVQAARDLASGNL